MIAAIGQRYLFRGDGNRSFVCEIVSLTGGINYRVVQLINEKRYVLGEELYYGTTSFNSEYFTYLEGQDAPK